MTIEEAAIKFGKNPHNVLRRLCDSVSVMTGTKLYEWSYDKENKCLLHNDGKTVLQWQVRQHPDLPQSYSNQQTSVGTVVVRQL